MLILLCHILHHLPGPQVFLPLLVEYFSENELKRLTQVVVGLHHLEPGEEEDTGEKDGSCSR